MQSKIMYIERKIDGLRGEGRIGLVEFSKSGKTLYYEGKVLVPASGFPLKANYYDKGSLEDYWVSGIKKDGTDAIFTADIEIDENVREEYWCNIRNLPENIQLGKYRSKGRSKKEIEKLEKGLRRRQMDNGWMPS